MSKKLSLVQLVYRYHLYSSVMVCLNRDKLMPHLVVSLSPLLGLDAAVPGTKLLGWMDGTEAAS